MKKLILIMLLTFTLLSASCNPISTQKVEKKETQTTPEPTIHSPLVATQEPVIQSPLESVQEEFKEFELLDTLLCDVNGDGKQDTIRVFDNEIDYFFTINDSTETHVILGIWEVAGYESIQVLEFNSNQKCLLVSYYSYGSYTSIWYFEGLKPIKMFDDGGFFVEYKDDILTISSFTESIGSWYTDYKYFLSKDGVYELNEPLKIWHVTFETITTKIDLEVHYYDGEHYTIDGILVAEEKITFTHILRGIHDDYMYFELHDGIKGRLHVEWNEASFYNRTVNGKSIDECFIDVEKYFNDTWL